MKKYNKPAVKTARMDTENVMIELSATQIGATGGGKASEAGKPDPEAKPTWF